MKKFLSYVSVVAGTVVVTLALSSAILQPKASAAPVPAAAAVPAPVPAATPDRHPHIDEALEHTRCQA